MNTSRWGVRGSEDLGDGLKAHFQLEGGINPDTGTQADAASLFDRDALVGLSGKWGKLDAGRTPSLAWDYTPVFDPLTGALPTPIPTSRSGGKASLLVNNMLWVTGNPYNNTKQRDNSIKYTYAADSGLLAALAYSVGEVPGDSKKRAGRQVAIGYLKGPFSVVLVHDRLHDAANLEQRLVAAGGNVSFASAFKFSLGYAAVSADAAFAPSSNAVAGAIANYISAFGVTPGGTIKIATTDAGLSYMATPALTLTGALYHTRIAGTGIATNEYDNHVLFARYALSKRSAVYGALDRSTTSDHGPVRTVSGSRTNTGLTVGMQTRF